MIETNKKDIRIFSFGSAAVLDERDILLFSLFFMGLGRAHRVHVELGPSQMVLHVFSELDVVRHISY